MQCNTKEAIYKFAANVKAHFRVILLALRPVQGRRVRSKE